MERTAIPWGCLARGHVLSTGFFLNLLTVLPAENVVRTNPLVFGFKNFSNPLKMSRAVKF
jgi:hypothetical protein